MLAFSVNLFAIPVMSPRAKYADRATAACQRS
jgi:hypothetical protein